MPNRKILSRLLILLTPLLVWQAVEQFVLPIDRFTIRFLEAAGVLTVHILPGPFYPNLNLEEYSAGDLAQRGPKDKLIRFHSDEFGQRNPGSKDDLYDIVIVGDSNIAGSHIDEPNTIRAALEKYCNCKVYAYGRGLPNNILSFLEDERFTKKPPALVIFEFRPADFEQGTMPIYEHCKDSSYANSTMVARTCNALDSPLLRLLKTAGLNESTATLMYIDRLSKQPAYHYLHSRLHLSISPRPEFTPAIRLIDAHLEKSKNALLSYRAAVEKHGSAFALFVMPRYTVGERRGMVAPWLAELRKVPFQMVSIDSTTTPRDVLSSWWMKNDTHWREESIDFSARLISKQLGEQLSRTDRPEPSMQ